MFISKWNHMYLIPCFVRRRNHYFVYNRPFEFVQNFETSLTVRGLRWHACGDTKRLQSNLFNCVHVKSRLHAIEQVKSTDGNRLIAVLLSVLNVVYFTWRPFIRNWGN